MAAQLLPWRHRLSVLLPSAVVVLFVIVLFASMQHRFASTARVERTTERIGNLRELVARVVDAETGQRGYIITGDSSYLDASHNADADATALLASLRQAYAGEAAPALVDTLQALIVNRLAALHLPVEARERGLDAAREELIAGRGRETLARVRGLMAELERRDLQQLEAEKAQQQRAAFIVLAILLVGAVVVVATGITVNRQLVHDAVELEELNAHLRTVNKRLEEQALELEVQASELQEANEELVTQQSQLEHMAVELESSNEELVALNSTLEERTFEAEEANRTKAEFLRNMSHELRTPLNAIAGYVDLLDLGVHGSLNTEQRHYLQRVRQASSHLLMIITDILNFAKIQAGKLELQLTAVPLGKILGEAEHFAQPLVQSKRIAFDCASDAGNVDVVGDPDRIRQVLLNLLSNAVKYTGERGRIGLCASSADDSVRIRVSDTGPGIARDLHDAIFDPFVQLKSGRDALNDGVGLGLAISRELARAMHGELSIESEPGKGSTFTLVLPSRAGASKKTFSAHIRSRAARVAPGPHTP